MRERGLRRWATSCCVVALLVSPPVLAAPDRAKPIAFDITGTDLTDALNQFAQQSDQQIVFTSAATAGKRTQPLRGRFTADQALAALLRGTGLSVRESNGVLLVEEAAAGPKRTGAELAPRTQTAQDATSATAIAPTTVARMEEIVVTALKKAERLRDVPAAVTALGGNKLEQMDARELTEIGAYVPGLVVSGAGVPGRSRLTIRGLGSTQSTSMVGTYVDDVPLGSSNGWAGGSTTALDLLPYDLERIEVLRGPQGTLYGANTMGGLLKYVTRLPDPQHVTVRVGAEGGGIRGANEIAYGLRASVNAPLVTDTAAVRVSAYQQHTPGFIDNVPLGKNATNAVDQFGARFAFRWLVNDDVELRVAALGSRTDADGRSTVAFRPGSTTPLYRDLTANNRLAQPYRQDVRNVSVTLLADLFGAKLTSATGYSEMDTRDYQDNSDQVGDLFPLLDPAVGPGLSSFETNLHVRKWTQELRLASEGEGRFTWLVGAFATREQSNNRQVSQAIDPTTRAQIASLSDLLTTANPTRYTEWAVFGQATVKIVDAFDVAFGMRWSSNDQRWAQVVEKSRLAVLGLPVGTTLGTSSEDVFTYSVSPRYRIFDDGIVYARVASGYRPGGPNTVLPNIPKQVNADTLVSYELGAKIGFLNQRASIDAALFHIDWSDIQVLDTLNGVNFFANAGKAKSEGVEIAASVLVGDDLTLSATAAYTDAKLTQGKAGLGGAGDRLPFTSKWTGSIIADYQHPIAAGLSLRANAAFRYVGERFSTVSSLPNALKIPSYSAVDLSIGLGTDAWDAALFVKNVADERGLVGLDPVTSLFGKTTEWRGAIIEPRRVGVKVNYRF